jgi:hypothetical protein
MSNPLSGTNEKPSLSDLQYLQDNWGKDEIAAAHRICKVVVATGGNVEVAATIPIGAEIIGARTVCTRTNGGGTMQVRTGSDVAITDAMTCAVDDAVTYATSIANAGNINIVSSDGVEVIANSIDDGGIVYIDYIMQ